MQHTRPKLKTAFIQLRVDPQLKAAAERAADQEHRNLTNWIEVLILTRCRELHINAEPIHSQETQA
jgi:hypothetical protein